MRHARIARILRPGVQLVLACALPSALTAGVRPEPLPDPQSSGFEYPVSEASLLARVSAMARGDAPARGAALAPRFTGARYVDLGDPAFVGTLQTEFLWSLPRHAR